MNRFKDLQVSFDALLRANTEMRDDYFKVNNHLHADDPNFIQVLRDICTISINSGYSTGKTSLILKNADTDDLIVGISEIDQDTLSLPFKATFFDRLSKADRTYRRIWVDNTSKSYQNAQALENLYKLLGKTTNQLFILIG